jgi:hypothetical protein
VKLRLEDVGELDELKIEVDGFVSHCTFCKDQKFDQKMFFEVAVCEDIRNSNVEGWFEKKLSDL